MPYALLDADVCMHLIQDLAKQGRKRELLSDFPAVGVTFATRFNVELLLRSESNRSIREAIPRFFTSVQYIVPNELVCLLWHEILLKKAADRDPNQTSIEESHEAWLAAILRQTNEVQRQSVVLVRVFDTPKYHSVPAELVKYRPELADKLHE